MVPFFKQHTSACRRIRCAFWTDCGAQQESQTRPLEAKVLSLLAADQAMLRSELSKRLVEKKISGNSTGQEVLFRDHSVKPAIPCFLRKIRTPLCL